MTRALALLFAVVAVLACAGQARAQEFDMRDIMGGGPNFRGGGGGGSSPIGFGIGCVDLSLGRASIAQRFANTWTQREFHTSCRQAIRPSWPKRPVGSPKDG